LLLDDKGYLKLADFGLAKYLKETEKAMTICGTPEYLSPEVING
jgi:serine/threonine protein kinase